VWYQHSSGLLQIMARAVPHNSGCTLRYCLCVPEESHRRVLCNSWHVQGV